MNAGLAHSIESLFGPASEPVDIAAFLESAAHFDHSLKPEQENSSVEKECRLLSLLEQYLPGLMASSVDDLRSTLYDIWDDPTLSAYILKNHEHTIGALHSAASKSIRTGRKSNFPDPDRLLPEVATLQKKMDSSKLMSWRFVNAK
jgi:hypothetical protein